MPASGGEAAEVAWRARVGFARTELDSGAVAARRGFARHSQDIDNANAHSMARPGQSRYCAQQGALKFIMIKS